MAGTVEGEWVESRGLGQEAYACTFWVCCSLAALLVYAVYFLGADDPLFFYDAPRHAMNGAFVLDAVRAFPIADPMGWAWDYFDQYPGLSFGLYPPMFYVELAAAYSVLGMSENVAQAVVSAHAVALFIGLALFFRHATQSMAALAAALFFMMSPVLVLWGRQIMLDVPMLSWMIFGVIFFLRFIKHDRTGDLIAAIVLLVLGIYTKQLAGILIVPALVTLIFSRGWKVFADKRLWIAGGLALVSLLPLLAIQLAVGNYYFEALGNDSDKFLGESGRFSLERLLYYPAQAANDFTPVGAAIIAAGLLAAVIQVWRRRGNFSSEESMTLLFMAVWAIAGYSFVSIIVQVNDSRFSLFAVPPMIWLAVWGLTRTLSPKLVLGTLVLGLLWPLGSAFFVPAPLSHAGYKAVTDTLASHTPAGGRMGIMVHLNGDIVWEIRSRYPSRDYHVMRVENLFIDTNIMPQMGYDIKSGSDDLALITKKIADQQLAVIAVEENFLNELPVMHLLRQAVRSLGVPIATFSVVDHKRSRPREITIYQIGAKAPAS